MSGRSPARRVADTRGFGLVEALVATMIFAVVALGIGSLYLATARQFATASAETSLQRGGTLIQEELTRHLLRASALQVQTGTVPLCQPSAGVTLPPNEALLYQRFVQVVDGGPLVAEFWCVFRHQERLRRCPVPGLLPPQTCTGTPADLLHGAQLAPGEEVVVTGARFEYAAVPGATATTMDLGFDLDLRRPGTTVSLLGGPPRRFSLNVTIRN